MRWDLILITARTAQQRWLFERYLGRLWPAGDAGRAPEWAVLQDPPGPQHGTAGATLFAVATAARRMGERLPGARVLILHCGGLSQRVPQLAHVGKAFAPGSGDQEETLFVQVVAELDRLFGDSDPGAVVACGDVLYTAPLLGVRCRQNEAVAVAYRTSAAQASRHGVYLWEAGREHVAEAWQKPDPARLLALDAPWAWGMDTGILYLGAGVVEAMLRAVSPASPANPSATVRRRSREWCGLELYRDLIPAMTAVWGAPMRLPGAPGAVQRSLSRFTLRVVCPPRAELLHFGTNEELMRILGAAGTPRVHASYVAAGDLAAGVVLDRCLAERPIQIGAASYVSGLNRPEAALRIGPARVAYQLPLQAAGVGRGREACVVIGASDDARLHPQDGATLLGEPLTAFLRELGACPEAVWEGVPERERSLWNARLFPVGEGDAVAAMVPWLGDAADAAYARRVDCWRRWPRLSMAEAHRLFDARRWWAHEERIRAHRFAAQVEAAVRQGDGARVGRFLEDPGIPVPARTLARRRLERLGRAEAASLTGARAWLVASRLSPPAAEEGLRERGFHSLSRALLSARPAGGGELEWRLAVGEAVEARAPVRVDLVGGWTDTPPQACERGGTVLNLSLLLDGRRPLAARVERLAEPLIELVAEDLGARRTLSANPPGRQRLDPRDPFALHLAGLRLVGLFSAEPLAVRLRRLGGGLRLTTTADVPKGSGLGASSILGAALLAALYYALDQPPTLSELCLRVLQLEQLMGTGGGWQDQVGGMWGGIKFAHSEPGVNQYPAVETVVVPPAVQAGLEERLVLFYTGEPRLAKDVLQRVVGRYLVGSPETVAALEEMPALAQEARSALTGGDWNRLGRCLDRSWALNRQLEPTCTNDSLEALFSRIQPLVLGAKLAGAGGGGFLFALARDRAAREQLEQHLASAPLPARLYQATLDQEGLIVLAG